MIHKNLLSTANLNSVAITTAVAVCDWMGIPSVDRTLLTSYSRGTSKRGGRAPVKAPKSSTSGWGTVDEKPWVAPPPYLYFYVKFHSLYYHSLGDIEEQHVVSFTNWIVGSPHGTARLAVEDGIEGRGGTKGLTGHKTENGDDEGKAGTRYNHKRAAYTEASRVNVGGWMSDRDEAEYTKRNASAYLEVPAEPVKKIEKW
ncbi:hypothetical protein C8R48DRAFT_761312 [Suillus tomentosus]|nr:hypothetical protein C8R48DRAFT_761312 [Suillus tomentosus]